MKNAPSVSRRNLLLGSASIGIGVALSPSMMPTAQAQTSDSFLPNNGDSRYSVSHYSIGDTIMTSSSSDASLYGATTMTCKANQSLTSLFFDFALSVTGVQVNGTDVKFTKTSWRQFQVSGFSVSQESSFTLVVHYSDKPNTRNQTTYHNGVTEIGSTIAFGGEPDAAIYWYPSNDRIDNKATYEISISTQATNKIVGNRNPGGYYTFTSNGVAMINSHCTYNKPMSSYHPGLVVGPVAINEGTWSIQGQSVPYQIASNTTISSVIATHTPQSLTYFSNLYGSYPFERAGGVMLSTYPVGAQETVGCCQYHSPLITGQYGASFVAHENAHMWFGNAVTASSWGDVILLHEGLAVLLEHDYIETYGGSSIYTPQPSTLAGKSGPSALAQTDPYNSAYGVMRELRYAMDGSYKQSSAPKFTALLKDWVSTYTYGNANRSQFKQMANKHAGKDLTSFFTKYGF